MRYLSGEKHLLPGNRNSLAEYKSRHFHYVVEGKVATITLNRPERKNPLTFDSYAELRDLFAFMSQAEDVKAIVLTGAVATF
jgi:enoyl-CoA hydratase/carnithine racemase